MTKYSTLEQLFEEFSKKNIMIIGDVMIDAYLWGKVDRISPEAPVPVIAFTKEEERLGGAANVALNIKSLGAVPLLCSIIGDDQNSQNFFDLLEKETLSHEGIIKDASRITTVKTRVISNHQHLLRVDREVTSEINERTSQIFLDRILSILNQQTIDAIIFQDYDKGVITPEIIRKVVETANQKKIPTLVDPKKRHFMDYKDVTLFKPNFKELKEGLNLDIVKSDTEAIRKVIGNFGEQQNISILLLTLSEYGVLITDRKEHHQIPAEIRDIADVSGAGDTVISMASLCLASGVGLRETALLSNFAGGLVCEKSGVVPVEKEWFFRDGFVLN